MSETKPPRYTLHNLMTGVISGLLSALIICIGGYFFFRESISNMVAEGVAILNIHDTATSLNDISTLCRDATGMLTTPTTRPSLGIVESLRQSVKSVKKDIGAIRQIEYSSIHDIERLAQQGHVSDQRMEIIRLYKNRPKREVRGIPKVRPQIAKLEEMLESLDRQLRQEQQFDIASVRGLVANIEKTAAAAQASLESRQMATLQTLEKFGKER